MSEGGREREGEERERERGVVKGGSERGRVRGSDNVHVHVYIHVPVFEEVHDTFDAFNGRYSREEGDLVSQSSCRSSFLVSHGGRRRDVGCGCCIGPATITGL